MCVQDLPQKTLQERSNLRRSRGRARSRSKGWRMVRSRWRRGERRGERWRMEGI